MSAKQLCLTSDEELSEDEVFPIIYTLLIVLNLLAIVAVSILIVLETQTKLKYHRVKETPPKLVLTREYLEKLRPPKRANPAGDVNTIPSQGNEGGEEAPKTNLNDPPPLESTQQLQQGKPEEKK